MSNTPQVTIVLERTTYTIDMTAGNLPVIVLAFQLLQGQLDSKAETLHAVQATLAKEETAHAQTKKQLELARESVATQQGTIKSLTKRLEGATSRTDTINKHIATLEGIIENLHDELHKRKRIEPRHLPPIEVLIEECCEQLDHIREQNNS